MPTHCTSRGTLDFEYLRRKSRYDRHREFSHPLVDMGANASKLDDALEGLDDGPSSTHLHTPPSTFNSYAQRVAVDTQDASSL
jgi:hypothetical protein